MSLHPSLKVDSAGAQQRTVLTRIERIKDLIKKGAWKEEQEVLSLPKTKILKVKAKRSKAAKEEGAAAAPAAAAPAKDAAKKPAK
ncbi:MAG TPA: small basic protein [Candidatus Omnitrophota bacterium]|jgi:small basic protein (TIGR04137 family)|nr:small basic protein [Candidatus Omnitrophota bacterium]